MKEKDLQKNLLELHVFDEKKEYRFIKKRKGELEVLYVTREKIMTISISKKFSRRKMKKRKIMHPVSRWSIIWFTMKMIC